MASSKSSHVCFLISVTAVAALCLYLSDSKGQKSLIQPLQLDGIPRRWCPPTGIAATTGTDHLITPEHGQSSLGSGSWSTLWQDTLQGVPSRSSKYVWVCWFWLASSPTTGANSPLGGDWLSAPPLPLATNPMTRPQIWSSNGLSCPGAKCTPFVWIWFHL